MYAIGRAESKGHSCEPTGHNMSSSEDHGVCIGSYGALQVGCVHYEANEDINNLETNVRIAHKVWSAQGYDAWTMYRNERYKEFIL